MAKIKFLQAATVFGCWVTSDLFTFPHGRFLRIILMVRLGCTDFRISLLVEIKTLKIYSMAGYHITQLSNILMSLLKCF